LNLDKILDNLFSEYIRRRAIKRAGGCEYSGTQYHDIIKEDGTVYPAWKQLQCSHVIGRSNRKVRWDLDNAFGVNGGSHMYLEHHPHEHIEFAKSKLGDGYDLLIARSCARGKVDKQGILIYLKEKLNEISL
jgi:hypothetical protein